MNLRRRRTATLRSSDSLHSIHRHLLPHDEFLRRTPAQQKLHRATGCARLNLTARGPQSTCKESRDNESMLRFSTLPVKVASTVRGAGTALLLGIALCTGCQAAMHVVPAPATDTPLAHAPGKQTAVFAGGCFWGTQSVFEHVRGVLATTAGYDGGTPSTATYDQVTTETTHHAESVEVVFDPSKITYGRLLQVFFSVVHDPTELNRQGPDVGTSYRSAIFTVNDDQRRIAQAYIAQLDAAHAFPKAIVTEVTANKGFYRAEDYHQDYALNNPGNPYIQVCDRPKVEALKQDFPDLYVPYKGK
jgi:peptide-methionine (S)-S-oxide reductase